MGSRRGRRTLSRRREAAILGPPGGEDQPSRIRMIAKIMDRPVAELATDSDPGRHGPGPGRVLWPPPLVRSLHLSAERAQMSAIPLYIHCGVTCWRSRHQVVPRLGPWAVRSPARHAVPCILTPAGSQHEGITNTRQNVSRVR